MWGLWLCQPQAQTRFSLIRITAYRPSLLNRCCHGFSGHSAPRCNCQSGPLLQFTQCGHPFCQTSPSSSSRLFNIFPFCLREPQFIPFEHYADYKVFNCPGLNIHHVVCKRLSGGFPTIFSTAQLQHTDYSRRRLPTLGPTTQSVLPGHIGTLKEGL